MKPGRSPPKLGDYLLNVGTRNASGQVQLPKKGPSATFVSPTGSHRGVETESQVQSAYYQIELINNIIAHSFPGVCGPIFAHKFDSSPTT